MEEKKKKKDESDIDTDYLKAGAELCQSQH